MTSDQPMGCDDRSVWGVRWSLEHEVPYFRVADVGSHPVPYSPWTRGKCRATGFLADGEQEWLEASRRLAGDVGLRRRLGAAGRELVEGGDSLRRGTETFADAIRGAVEVGGAA